MSEIDVDRSVLPVRDALQMLLLGIESGDYVFLQSRGSDLKLRVFLVFSADLDDPFSELERLLQNLPEE